MLDDLLLFLEVFLGHLVEVEAVDLGVMSGDSVLESVDWRSIHSILEKAKGGSPR